MTSKNSQPTISRHSMDTVEALLRHDHYTVAEAAYLLDISPDIIRHAIMTRDLPAFIVDHEVVSIRRRDLIEWLRKP
jgi:hypothetical protein